MIISQNLKLLNFKFAIIAHISNKYKQNTSASRSIFFWKLWQPLMDMNNVANFFGNACTKSGPLRFSKFSGCWLTLSVYWLMSFVFPFGRLLGVR